MLKACKYVIGPALSASYLPKFHISEILLNVSLTSHSQSGALTLTTATIYLQSYRINPSKLASSSSSTTSAMLRLAALTLPAQRPISAAVDKVLQLPELLEAIILELPPSNIIRVMSVARFWHDLIKNTRRLQDARVLKALPESGLERASAAEAIWAQKRQFKERPGLPLEPLQFEAIASLTEICMKLESNRKRSSHGSAPPTENAFVAGQRRCSVT